MSEPSTDPFVAEFFRKIPAAAAGSFDGARLDAIKKVFGTHHWRVSGCIG